MALRHVYRKRAECEPHNGLLKQFLATWNSKRDGRRFPSRQEMTPRDLLPLLPYTVLARVLPGSGDFEFRVIGAAVVEAYGENYTGRRLSQLGDSVCDAMRASYRAVAQTGEPVLLEGWFERSDHDAFRREVLLVPLGPGDDDADHVLSAGVYEAHNPIAVHHGGVYEGDTLLFKPAVPI